MTTKNLPTYAELMPRLAEALQPGGTWDESEALDLQLLSRYCETDLAGILRVRTEYECLHPLAGGRWSELHLDVLPKARTGLRPLTPRRYAAAACLEALEALSIPVYQGDGQPTFAEAESMEFGRLLLAEQLHKYIQHLTADEARPLLPMDAALQRIKAKVAQRATGAAPGEESPAIDGPQDAPERTSDEPQDVSESAEDMTSEPAISVACLATREQILDAYERWGFKAAWFDNLTDRQWLRDARKRKGQGQRGQVVEPLFCPYEVMQGLVNSTRLKNGAQRMSQDAGWRVLEHKFPAAYARVSMGDPRERTG